MNDQIDGMYEVFKDSLNILIFQMHDEKSYRHERQPVTVSGVHDKTLAGPIWCNAVTQTIKETDSSHAHCLSVSCNKSLYMLVSLYNIYFYILLVWNCNLEANI